MHEWSEDEIGAAIRVMLAQELFLDLDGEAIGTDDDLVGELGLGSLDLSELRWLCEKRFGVTIAETDFNPVHFQSVGTLTALVTDLLRQGTTAAT